MKIMLNKLRRSVNKFPDLGQIYAALYLLRNKNYREKFKKMNKKEKPFNEKKFIGIMFFYILFYSAIFPVVALSVLYISYALYALFNLTPAAEQSYYLIIYYSNNFLFSLPISTFLIFVVFIFLIKKPDFYDSYKQKNIYYFLYEQAKALQYCLECDIDKDKMLLIASDLKNKEGIYMSVNEIISKLEDPTKNKEEIIVWSKYSTQSINRELNRLELQQYEQQKYRKKIEEEENKREEEKNKKIEKENRKREQIKKEKELSILRKE